MCIDQERAPGSEPQDSNGEALSQEILRGIRSCVVHGLMWGRWW